MAIIEGLKQEIIDIEVIGQELDDNEVFQPMKDKWDPEQKCVVQVIDEIELNRLENRRKLKHTPRHSKEYYRLRLSAMTPEELQVFNKELKSIEAIAKFYGYSKAILYKLANDYGIPSHRFEKTETVGRPKVYYYPPDFKPYLFDETAREVMHLLNKREHFKYSLKNNSYILNELRLVIQEIDNDRAKVQN